jgi:WD40 repeat protein
MRKTIREKEPVRPSTRLATLAGEVLTSTARCRSSDAPKLIHLLRGDLDWIVMKCLEKDRTHRYETANGVAMDIKRHLDNEPVFARPQSAVYRFQKSWRRNKLVYTAGVAVAVALVAGVVGTSIGLFRAEREKANAQIAARKERDARIEALQTSELAKSQAGQLKTNLYFNRVALAHRESSAQPPNVKQAEKLLRDCPVDLRSWEWHYLKRRRFQMPIELKVAGAAVQSVVFSPDGSYLAAACGDGAVRLFDMANLRLVHTLSNHSGFVVCVAFHPTNVTWIASAGSDNRLRLWDWKSKKEIRSWPADSSKDYGMAYSVAFSPDGQRLAAPGTNGELVLRDIGTGETVLTLPKHEEGARSVDFSPDGRWIATGSGQGVVRLWDPVDGTLVKTLTRFGPPVGSVVFTRNAQRLVALRFDAEVFTWDTHTWQAFPSYSIREAGGPTVALAVLPDAERVITGGDDRLVTISEPVTGQKVLIFRELTSSCYGLALSPDGQRLAAGSRSGSLFIWNAAPLANTEDPSFRTLRYPSDEAWAFDIAPNGRSIAIGGYLPRGATNAPIVTWNIPNFEPAHELAGYPIIVFSLAFGPDGDVLASAGDEPARYGRAKVKVWNLKTGQEAFPVEAFEMNERLLSVTFSHDGRWLIGGGNAKKIRVWDAATGRKVCELGEHSKEISKVCLSPNGRYLATMGNDDVVKIWDGTRLNQPQSSSRHFSGMCAGISDLLSFSPDGGRVVIVTNDSTAVIHDLDGADRALPLVSQNHRPLALAFSPDGRWVASGGVDCTVRLWDARNGSMLRILRSHTDVVTRLRFLRRPEALWLISGSRDGTVKFWDEAIFSGVGETENEQARTSRGP